MLAFVLVLLSTAVVIGFVKPAVAEGTIYIRANGLVEGTDKIVSVDNVTYTLTANITTDDKGIVIERDNIILDGAGYTIKGNETNDGVYLTGRNNVTIKHMNIQSFGCGIRLFYSSNIMISGNNISNPDISIHGEGIHFHYSSNIMISGNTISIQHVAITMEVASNTTMRGNTITNNNWGIGTYNFSDSNIFDNAVIDNGFGIDFNGVSVNINVCGNNVTDNDTGIRLIDEASDNFIYHNNFINNTQQASVEQDLANIWDMSYPSGGNYWSDYNGIDANEDGIGDTPYTVVVGTAQDEYPLMGPISFFDAGTWNEIIYYAHTVSNSTVSDFYFSESENLISFNVTGLDDTVGFCRVAIPNELLWCDNPEQWQIWVNNTLIEDRNVMEDTSYVYIYFDYNQSTQNVEVVGVHAIPEFPAWTSMLLILIVLIATLTIYKRRPNKTLIH